MRFIIKEPLLHFLLLGAGLFVLFSLLQSEPDASDRQIVVSENKITQLTEIFKKTYQRLPVAAEKQALIDNYVKQELAFEMGKELGLLENDSIIKNRVKQKLEFIIEDSVNIIEPDDNTLQEFISNNLNDYKTEPLFSFRQVYFNQSKHDNVFNSMDKLKRQLVLDENIIFDKQGDTIFLDDSYMNVNGQQVSRYFGSQFLDALRTLPLNEWQTKVRSGYGLHLVKLSSRELGKPSKLSDIKQKVKQDWLNQQRKQSLKKFYEESLKRYVVSIDQEKTTSLSE